MSNANNHCLMNTYVKIAMNDEC